MRFTKTSSLLALGLAGRAVADDWDPTSSSTSTSAAPTSIATGTTWADWDPVSSSSTSTSQSVAPASTVASSTWADWDPSWTSSSTSTSVAPTSTTASSTSAGWEPSSSIAAVSTVIETTTSTVFKKTVTVFEDVATVYASTVFVGPATCPTTAVTFDASGKPFSPLATSTATEVWTSEVSTIGTNDAVFTWTGDAATSVSTVPVPTYTGWPTNGSTPTPGSSSSNVTAPIGPIKGGGSCNSAGDRSKWCNGLSISDDYYTNGYSTGQVCAYDLTITNTTIDFDGSGPKVAFAINGQVPGPLIECNWGDTLHVTVHNKLTANSTSIHWHGIYQRGSNDQDGVPGITECAIAPGSSRTYTMQLSQYGTGWYHSHAGAQFGDGIRGPMVIHGPATANYDIDMGPVMIDDTFPGTVAQQNSIIAHTGPTGTVNYLLNGHNTLPDLSGGQHTLWNVQPGKKHLFRFINSASQNMYSVHFDNHVMTVIAADYVPIVPYTTEWLNIGIGQRYDVIIEMNQPVAGYFLRAVTQTGCPSGCTNTGLGAANGIFLYDGASSTLPTSTYGNKTAADFAICLDEPIASLTPFVAKSAGSSSAFGATASTIPAGNVAQVASSDDGNVFRWFLNNGVINVNYTQPTLQTLAQGGGSNSSSSSNSSLISNSITLSTANEWVYFIIQNQFFASHPMHLHGHDFSLLGQGTVSWTPDLVSTLNFVNPPRRDTAMLVGSAGPGNPAGYTVIGFETDNPGAWLMHCHIVWHVDGGLALQWLERPDEIKPYAKSPAFQNECSSLDTWQQANPAGVHSTGESGLKRRTYFDTFLESRSKDVVRRSDSSERQFLESNLKRGLGDGHKHRHMHH